MDEKESFHHFTIRPPTCTNKSQVGACPGGTLQTCPLCSAQWGIWWIWQRFLLGSANSPFCVLLEENERILSRLRSKKNGNISVVKQTNKGVNNTRSPAVQLKASLKDTGGCGGGQFHTLIREASGKHDVKVDENTDASTVLISSRKETQQCGRV